MSTAESNNVEEMDDFVLPNKATPPIIPNDFSLDGSRPASRKGSFTSLSPTLKERRRKTLKYFAQNEDLDKEEIMDFLQNEIKRKTSIDNNNNDNLAEMMNNLNNNNNNIDNDSDAKDDFDSDIDEHQLHKNFILDDDDKNNDNDDIDKNNDNILSDNMIVDNFKLDRDSENDLEEEEEEEEDDGMIKNGEEPSWNELLMDDSTRQQFEELAREYVGNIAEEKRKLQNEHYKLQQQYLKLQESNKSNEENIENLHKELNEKDELMMKLENELTTLSVNKQDLQTNIAKLELALQHNDDTIENLNANLIEYKNQNQLLSQNLDELTIKMDETENELTLNNNPANNELNLNENDGQINIAEYDKIMDKIELAFKTNKKQIIIEIINSLKANSLKSNDEIKTLIEEKTKLKTQINDFEKEQQTLSLNNEALKNLVETHQTRLKNIQKQHQTMKNKYNNTKQLSEQLQIDINAKNEFIHQLKQQNEKLESSSQELMIINSDLRHELEIYDQTILNNKKSPSQKKLSKNDSRKAIQRHVQISDRKSFDEDEEEESDDDNNLINNMPSLILTDRDRLNGSSSIKPRRSSVPTSIYEQNLDIIVKSVNHDEYKFMEDLSKEKMTLEPQPIRSEILKKCHSDAEKEFFFMMVLTCKLEISTSLGFTNSSVSDISPQTLWIKAQEKTIALHEFHDFIKNTLIKIAQHNKSRNEQIKHIWSSYNSMIADKLRQNDLKKYKANNPHLDIVDPETHSKQQRQKQNKKQQQQQQHENSKYNNKRMDGTRKEKRSKNGRHSRQRSYTVSVTPYSNQQTLIDEDEDDIIASMNKNGNKKSKHKRRDSQNMKKEISKHFQELQQQQQELQQAQIENDDQLLEIQTQKKINNIRQTDTYDLL